MFVGRADRIGVAFSNDLPYRKISSAIALLVRVELAFLSHSNGSVVIGGEFASPLAVSSVDCLSVPGTVSALARKSLFAVFGALPPAIRAITLQDFS